MLYVCQKVIHADISHEYILSPYVIFRAMADKNSICIERSDTKRHIILTADSAETLQKLIECLRSGMCRKELEDYLNALGVQDAAAWIELCQKEGILE